MKKPLKTSEVEILFDDIIDGHDQYFRPIQTLRAKYLYPDIEIKADTGVVLLPDGTIAFNAAIKRGRWDIKEVKNHFPCEVIGVDYTANYRVDLLTSDCEGDAGFIFVSYFIRSDSLTTAEMMEIINQKQQDYHARKSQKGTQPGRTEKRVPNVAITIDQNEIDHGQNLQEAREAFRVENYPQTLELLAKNDCPGSNELAEALYLDFRAQGACEIELETLRTAIMSREFCDKLARAVRAGQQRRERFLLELILLRGWIDKGYMKFSGEDLAEEMLRITGQAIKCNTLTKIVRRLGLQRKTGTGRPPNPG